MEQYFFMMIGLPASGKSIKAKELAEQHNANIHSSDKLREELFDSVDVQDKNGILFQELHKRIKKDLVDGKSTIYDATNISYKRRKAFLSEIKKYECKKVAVLMATPYEECLQRNQTRDRKVSEYVIKKMYMRWNTPYWYEGWDDIQIIYSQDKSNFPTPFYFIHKYAKYDQESKHHRLSLGWHSNEVGKYISKNDGNSSLTIAGFLHDCGKPFTKSFVNYKGEKSDNAHYYQHHCVGAYDSLFFNTGESNPLDHAILIQWHMQPYFWEKERNITTKEKHKAKYKKLWGDKLFEDIMLLHKADKLAH